MIQKIKLKMYVLESQPETRPDRLPSSNLVKASLKCYRWAIEPWVFGKTKKEGEISEDRKRLYWIKRNVNSNMPYMGISVSAKGMNMKGWKQQMGVN